MPLPTKLLGLATLLVLSISVFELVRKKKMREEYSLLWLAATFGFALLLIFDVFTERLIAWVGGVNLASFFFFAGVFFSVLMILHLTVRVSELKRKQNVLIQETGLLKEKLERLSGGQKDCSTLSGS